MLSLCLCRVFLALIAQSKDIDVGLIVDSKLVKCTSVNNRLFVLALHWTRSLPLTPSKLR